MNDETRLDIGILDICKPLIEERKGETIALVHFSAREYVSNKFVHLLELISCRYLLHQLSGPYISYFRVQADLTIACLRYLLTCSPIFSGALSASAFCHIVKGFHDIFPYVYEFGHDHLLKYSEALRTQSDDEKRVETVEELLSKFETSQSQSGLKALGSDSGAAVAEDPTLDTEPNALHALPPAVRQYIVHRKNMPLKQSSSAQELDNNSDLAQTDPTWISTAYRNFQRAFESLLGDSYNLDYHHMSAKYFQMMVTLEDIQNFKIRHSQSAYLCRWSGCLWASAGFRSTAEREKHEVAHKQKFLCSDPSCEFANNGFASRHALRKHNLKYHTRVEDHVLPAFLISEGQSDMKSGASDPKAKSNGLHIEIGSDDFNVGAFRGGMTGGVLGDFDFDSFQQSTGDGEFPFDESGMPGASDHEAKSNGSPFVNDFGPVYIDDLKNVDFDAFVQKYR